jgi:beta-phosphoglucomutase-like phosphatase (HAD superfamily)
MFSGYIFDVEGTLVDSVPQNLRSLQEALEEAGVDNAVCRFAAPLGLDGNQTLQIIAPDLDEAMRKRSCMTKHISTRTNTSTPSKF